MASVTPSPARTMDTSLIIGLAHPSQGGLILESLIEERQLLPVAAKAVTSVARLSVVLRLLTVAIQRSKGSWLAYQSRDAVWFYAGWVESTGRGRARCVTLSVRRYGVGGKLLESAKWTRKFGGSWHKVRLPSRAA